MAASSSAWHCQFSMGLDGHSGCSRRLKTSLGTATWYSTSGSPENQHVQTYSAMCRRGMLKELSGHLALGMLLCASLGTPRRSNKRSSQYLAASRTFFLPACSETFLNLSAINAVSRRPAKDMLLRSTLPLVNLMRPLAPPQTAPAPCVREVFLTGHTNKCTFGLARGSLQAAA